MRSRRDRRALFSWTSRRFSIVRTNLSLEEEEEDEGLILSVIFEQGIHEWTRGPRDTEIVDNVQPLGRRVTPRDFPPETTLIVPAVVVGLYLEANNEDGFLRIPVNRKRIVLRMLSYRLG